MFLVHPVFGVSRDNAVTICTESGGKAQHILDLSTIQRPRKEVLWTDPSILSRSVTRPPPIYFLIFPSSHITILWWPSLETCAVVWVTKSRRACGESKSRYEGETFSAVIPTISGTSFGGTSINDFSGNLILQVVPLKNELPEPTEAKWVPEAA
jgi:hypothetical protein